MEVFKEFVENYKKGCAVSEDTTVDEKLETFIGSCSFRQYIPSKLSKYEVKDISFGRCPHVLHLQHGSQREGPYKRNSNPVMWRD
jgi:hypothetical protein